MMGNESSQLNSLNIETKANETTDFWSHHQATISDSCRFFSLKGDGSVSVFKGKAVAGPLWNISMPLEKFTNNLLKYRHPYIVRYISSWQQKSTFHLVTEYVQPLSQVVPTQTPLQICIGLNNILQALVFLHEQGSVSHNNVSISSVYVSGDGQWKLGGLQYLCSFKELTPAYLKHARIHRYDKAIDPNEESNKIITKVDQFGYGVLVEDVFKNHRDEDVPHLKEFRKYCRDVLQHIDPQRRPNLSEVLNHDFFNHNFISMYKFLNILPLKSEDEKSEFFMQILSNLENYDEETVAKQFGGLLLSRHTLLDHTAREYVLPFILRPKKDRPQPGEQPGFFSIGIFKEHVKPRLLQLFGVRDIQIRTLLLSHFMKFVHVFTHEELSQLILPELLLGIKDVNDSLVSSTLVCLSELVPILGADSVVGGKRSKLFIDGKPNSIKSFEPNKSTEVLNTTTLFHHDSELCSVIDQSILLNERPTPVGGESFENDDHVTTMEASRDIETQSDSEWDDWDNKQQTGSTNTNIVDIDFKEVQLNIEDTIYETPNVSNSLVHATNLEQAGFNAKRNIIDISELDIKNQKIEISKRNDEFDFFADMTPVIEKQEVALVEEKTNISTKLNFVPDDNLNGEEGWGDSWSD
ncbi:protein-associating with the carboxyl-terminal domain of ezrin [Aricia agestis]|uniref:protein-associating with the carboxyl-terminal domain of ezrin n=1 Tax=Aricia agestis TaxID=91739 RepID=UPI001C20410D|nr:protein-associating with the carboxyl-terminal domain of ezrin [Aricia agestis]